jgi:hypothetical protein
MAPFSTRSTCMKSGTADSTSTAAAFTTGFADHVAALILQLATNLLQVSAAHWARRPIHWTFLVPWRGELILPFLLLIHRPTS